MTNKELVDEIFSLQQQKLDFMKSIDKQISNLKLELKAGMDKLGVDAIVSASGHTARIKVRRKLQVPNWLGLFSYIKKYDAIDLLQRRLTDSAVKARLDYGDEELSELVESVDVEELTVR